ncbi:MAG: hypothetical protein JW728_03150 [Candidatus Aureabacteria bacterium]|nr:hypothetical protein [Candidatus Auribacterota bacterium]
MIKVDISTAFIIYLCLTLGLVLFAWIFFEYRFKVKRVNPQIKRTCRCPICAFVYIYDVEEEYSRCPRCGSINENKKIKQENE